MAQAWLQFLERDCGLLVEYAPGELGFLHLSIMEYLASRCFDDDSELPGYADALGAVVFEDGED